MEKLGNRLLLSLIVILHLVNAAYGSSDSYRRCDPAFIDMSRALRSLPTPGSVKWNAYLEQLRSSLNPQIGPGFAVLDLQEYIPEELAQRLFEAMPRPQEIYLEPRNSSSILSRRQERAFRPFVRWVTLLLREALDPNEPLILKSAFIRVSTDFEVYAAKHAHIDAESFTISIPYVGPNGRIWLNTPRLRLGELDLDGHWERIRARPADLQVPGKHALFLSDNDRAELYPELVPSVHGSPLDSTFRMVLFLRYGIYP
jgi:hypothetical protein